MTIVEVTDHAVLRYLERQHGLDVEFFRQHIRELVLRGAEAGASGVIVEDVKFVLQDGSVVTCLEKGMRSRDLRSGRGG